MEFHYNRPTPSWFLGVFFIIECTYIGNYFSPVIKLQWNDKFRLILYQKIIRVILLREIFLNYSLIKSLFFEADCWNNDKKDARFLA